MATRLKPPRSWEIDDLEDLGKKSGVTYLKAVPVLILEKWVQEGRKEGTANYVWTKHLAKRLVSSELVPPFKPKGTSNIIAAMSDIQKSRSLIPPLIDYRGEGMTWINLPHYEPLLQEYRKEYNELYPEDYKKLYPDREPEWELPSLPKVRAERRADVPIPTDSEVRDEIQSLLAPIEQALLDRQQSVQRLIEENQKLHADLEARKKEAPEVSFVHTSPDFSRSCYAGTVTSIKETIGDMLNRAEHAIRISTRQMDMFADVLMALKRRSPDIEITVLSRGPERTEGDRKKIAGRTFERMKEAGIKMPVEKDILHSRLVVIDEKEVLVSSADLDFTQMEQEFNAGIWTNNPDVVAEAIRYFNNLLEL